MISLKPCPFCGSKARLSERLNYVTCGNELCVIGNTTSVWFLPEQWNTRAPTAETARADAYKQALHEISLSSQNSLSSKTECGKIARKVLEQKP